METINPAGAGSDGGKGWVALFLLWLLMHFIGFSGSLFQVLRWVVKMEIFLMNEILDNSFS